MAGGNESDPLYRVYDFRKNRCHDNVIDILKGYNIQINMLLTKI